MKLNTPDTYSAEFDELRRAMITCLEAEGVGEQPLAADFIRQAEDGTEKSYALNLAPEGGWESDEDSSLEDEIGAEAIGNVITLTRADVITTYWYHLTVKGDVIQALHLERSDPFDLQLTYHKLTPQEIGALTLELRGAA